MKASRVAVVLGLAIALSAINVQGQSCQWTDASSGDSYDLSPLINNANDYTFGYDPTDPVKKVYANMCRALVTTLCGPGSAFCQQWDPKNAGGQASLGQASTMSFGYGAQKSNNGVQGLIVRFDKGDPVNTQERHTEVDLVCQKGAGAGMPAFWNEDNLIYYFTWTTEFACPVSGPHAGGGGGLSGGSILLIILLVVAVVYLVGGILFISSECTLRVLT